MTKLAKLIATEEGFFKSGSLPARRHNPGDLRHAPGASHEGIGPNDIGIEPDDVDGWTDLERQLRLDADRGMTLGEAVYSWAPPTENDTPAYLQFVLDGFGGQFSPTTPLSEVLEVQA